MKHGLYLAFVYIGLVIGASFASGREIMEYFNLPSSKDHSGVVLASLLLIILCYMILRRAYLSDLCTCDDYLYALAGRGARLIKLFMLFYLFCGFFTMLSGCGALFGESLMFPPYVGNIALAALCFLILVFDLRGIITLNMFLVPAMVLGILYVCFAAAVSDAKEVFSLHTFSGGMLTSAVCYVSYNTVSAPSVLIPLQKGITPRGIRTAAVLGGSVLGLLIFCIWISQGNHSATLWNHPLPMLKLAAMIGRPTRSLYALILFMAICTTAASQGFGILSFFHLHDTRHRVRAALLLCLLALPFSFFGFADLVAHLYTFFGWSGLLMTALIFYDFIRFKP